MKLKKLIADYLALRRALSPGFDALENSLNKFCRAVGDEIEITDITPEQVKAFLDGTGQISRYWHRKYGALLAFYRYAVGRGYVASAPLPSVIPQPGPLITLRQTKFDKTRFVALGTELNQELAQYAAQRRQKGHDQSSAAPFFIGRHGERISRDTVEGSYRTLRKSAGICRTDGARYQPRLHDLRHAFAVHRLTTWYREGKDVQKLLPLLAIYLGHVDLSSTQIYLTMTPELLDATCERFERYAFQEVSHD